MKKYINKSRLVYQDKSKKKNLFKIFGELVSLAIAKKEPPIHYVRKYLYRSENTNVRDYLSAKEEELIRFSPNLHKVEYVTLLKNKLASALYFEQCGLKIPKMPSYNIHGIFFFDGRQTEIENLPDLNKFFLDVFERTEMDGLFIKPLAESGGMGCFILKKSTLKEQLKNLGQRLLTDSFIHQEVLKQHPMISRIYPHSINTLRIETYIDKAGQAHIMGISMRFGVAGNVVDNASAGGIYAAVNPETGTLEGKAFQNIKPGVTDGLFEAHPDTGHKINGSEIPYFEDAKKLVLDALRYVPDRYIGWDVAITETAPVLIEGNGRPFIADIAYRGYHKNALIAEVLQEARKNES